VWSVWVEGFVLGAIAFKSGFEGDGCGRGVVYVGYVEYMEGGEG